MWILLTLLVLSATGLGISILLLVRAAKRLLEFDSLFSLLAPELEEYVSDLRNTMKSGLLLDHPEVATFHQRNVYFLKRLETITQQVQSTSPPKDPQQQLPRPDVG